jgi:hypothetical protein
VLRQQCIEQSLPVVEGCRLETFERRREINQATARREIEHSLRAGDGKAAAAGNGEPIGMGWFMPDVPVAAATL